jgi:hypothetical protein
MVIRRYGEPSIKAVFSPLACDKDDQSSQSAFARRDLSAPSKRSLACHLSAAHIDHWKPMEKGLKIAEPDYQLEAFCDLQINPETASFIKASLNPQANLSAKSNHLWINRQ